MGNRREFREEFGYGISIEPDPIERETIAASGDDFSSYLSGLTPAEREQFDLQNFDCASSANGAIDQVRTDFVEALPSDARELIDAAASGLDPAFAEIEDKWVRCMAEAGYNYGGSVETYVYLTDELSLATNDDALKSLQQLERQIALADLTCTEPLQDELDARLAVIDQVLQGTVEGSSIYE